MELVRPLHAPAAPALELVSSRSVLAAARLRRSLTVEEAAKRAGIPADQVEWLEEGRVYRFPSTEHALEATLLLAAALELTHREARELAGLPVPPKPFEVNPRARLLVLGALAAAVAALVAALVLPTRADEQARAAEAARLAAEAKLPKPWEIGVDILNGNGNINYTRLVASRIGALGYHVARVARADRFDYPQTAVYYERGGRANAERLARQLRVSARPLPGGDDSRRLVVVVGPPRGPTG